MLYVVLLVTFHMNHTASSARPQLTCCRAAQLLPVVPEWQSDSGSFDAVLELLVHTGRELPETMVRCPAPHIPRAQGSKMRLLACSALRLCKRVEAMPAAQHRRTLRGLCFDVPLVVRCADDVHPGGVAERPQHGGLQEGLLPVPLGHHGALGRPRPGVLHRRAAHRRDAGPQRPAPGSLLHHQGRPRHPRLRSRRGECTRTAAPHSALLLHSASTYEGRNGSQYPANYPRHCVVIQARK